MSRTIAARRFSLLASTSFVAANMLAGGAALTATAFAPSVALAACTPDGEVVANPANATETCAGTDAEINYTNVTHQFDVILDGETVTTKGVSVASSTGQNLGITNVLNNSSITDTAGFAVVLTTTGAGNATIDFGGPTTVTVVGPSGIAADSGGSGTATVILGAGSTVTVTGTGIDSESDTGNVNITNDGAVKSTGAGGIGVFGFSDGGTVDYKGTGTITTTGAGSVGLRLETNTLNPGPTIIKATVGGAIDSAGSGIVVGNKGVFTPSGAVTVTTNATVTAKAGDGINITGAGGITLTANKAVTGTTGGIVVAETGAAASTINVKGAGTTIDGGAGTGVSLKDTTVLGKVLSDQTTLITGKSGIVASNTGGQGFDVIVGAVTGTAGDAIKVTDNGSADFTQIVTSGQVTSTGGMGINATNTAANNLSISENGGLTTNGNFTGISAVNTGTGNVSVAIGGKLSAGAAGVSASTTSGSLTVNLNAALTGDSDKNGSGDGIDASSVTGHITVNVGKTAFIGGDSEGGIAANVSGKTAAAEVITIKNDGAIGSTGDKTDFVGIKAFVTDGTGAGSIKVTGDGTIDSDSSAVWTNNFGSGSTTIAIKGAVTAASSTWAIIAENKGGTVDITSGPGAITADNGILATNTGVNGAGVVNVHIGGDITGSDVEGITASSSGTGTVTVDAKADGNVFGGINGIRANNGSKTGAVTVDLSGAKIGVEGGANGIFATTVGGDINVTTSGLVKAGAGAGVLGAASGAGNVFVNGVGPVTVTGAGDGIVLSSSTGNLTVGNTGTGYAGAIDPQGGGNGIKAVITNPGSAGNVSVTTAVGGTITGKANIGILASTSGLGSVSVDQSGAIGALATFVGADAIQATITNGLNTKDVTVAVKGNLSAINDGVNASTLGLGAVKVDGTNGIIAAQGIGISAVINNAKNVAGNVTVNTSSSIVIASGGDGILATTNGEGDVFVTSATGAMLAGQIAGGDGINAFINGPGLVSSDGSVTVVNTGEALSIKGAGIKAASNSNDDVNVTTSGTAFGTTFGITATTSGIGGAVTVTQTAGTTTQSGADTGAGISATITKAGNNDQVFVNITGGTVKAQGDGVFATTAGSGNVKVDNAGTINGGLSTTAGDGINAFAAGGGDVLVNNTGTVTGDPGIKAKAVGFGTVTVFTSGTVSAVNEGILTSTVDGANTVTVAGAGTVTSTTNIGISAKSTGQGLIDINTAAGTTVTSKGGSDGIFATQTGTGDVDIDAFGTIDAGDTGIHAETATGTINILTGSGKVTGGDGGAGFFKSGIMGLTFGSGTISIATGTGAVGTLTPGSGFSFGIEAQTNGSIDINVGSGGVFDGGINAVSTGATGSVTVVAGGDVTNTNGIGIGGLASGGLVSVTLAAGKAVTASNNGISVSSQSGPIIVTGLAGSSINAGADGIHATSAAAGGTILITHAGTITATSDGVDAATADATINVTVDGAVTAGGKGLSGVAGGANAVTITNNGAVKATGGEGLNLSSAGGNVTANANGSVEGTTAGIKTVTSGGGVTDINTTALVKATAGDGVNAFTSGGGPIDIDTGAVTGTVAGITAKSTGGSTITVDNAGAVAGGTGAGIHADTTGAGNITVTAGAAVSGATGVDIATTGTGTLTVADNGFAITGSAGDGIKAAGGTGNVNIGTGPGQRVTGPISGADDGIDAKGAGNINVYVNGNITGDSDGDGVGDGVHAQSTGAANTIVVDTTGGAIQAGDDGIEAAGVGATTVTVTNTDTINAKDRGILATSGSGALTVDNKGAIDTLAFGVGGDWGIEATSFSGTVKVDNTGNIGATGPGNGVDLGGIVAGIGSAGSTNNVTVNNSGKIFVDTGGAYGISATTAGTGDVVVNNDGEIDPPAIGITASGGGNVTVNTSKNVTASGTGILVVDFGVAGKVGTVKTTGGAVITGGVTGIELQSTVGANLVLDAKAGGLIVGGTKGVVATVSTAGNNGTITIDTAAQVTGTNNDGINASSVGNGAIKINTGAVTGGAAGDGVDASSTGGSSITIVTGGVVLGGQRGIAAATTGTGAISVTANDTVTGTADDGIKATTSGSGNVTVLSQKAVSGGNDGIEATSTGGVVLVTTNDKVLGSGGSGVLASSTGAGTVTVNLGGTAEGGAKNGVTASSGAGTIAINDAGAFSITGQEDGINATSTTGDINVGSSTANRINGVVLGKTDDGIDVQTGGSINVFTGANVTGGGDVGISAVSTGAGKAVVVDSTGGAIKGVQLGLFTRALGAGSTINIVNTDTVDSGDNTNIYAQATTGAVDIKNSGNIANTAFANNSNWGIYAETTTGQITVKNSGQVGTSAVSGGLDNFGIQAISTGANTAGITVTNSGAIWMDAGSTAGIHAENAGTGAVVVNNTGAIDPALYGVYAKGGGDVTVNNAANILAGTGIHADSTSVSAANTVSVFQRAPGTSIVGSAGNGIEASIAGPGTVNVGGPAAVDRIQGNVTGTGAGANGVFATGKGDVNVYTAGGTITGGSTGAAWGIKAQSTSVLADAVADEVVVNTQGLITGRQGILATNTGLTAGAATKGDTVQVTTTGAVTATDGNGIQAKSAAGDVTVSAGTSVTGVNLVAGGNAIGVDAESSAGGNVTVTTAGTIVGDLTGNAAGTGAAGIVAISAGGNGSVSVTANTIGSVSGGNYGIFASSVGTGSTTVNANVAVTGLGAGTVNAAAGPVGISATGGSGGVTVAVAAGQTVQAAAGRAIVTQSDGNAAITLGAGASARGLGDATHAVIDVTTTSAAGRNTITNAGLIQSLTATPGAYGDLAITGKTAAAATTGGTTINNNSGGTINGRLVFSGNQGTANVAFNNAAGAVWHTTGASALGVLGTGNDTITNAGQIFTNNAGSATSIDFGAGTGDSFTNTGALVAGEGQVAASASNLILTGLETFTNNGQISFGGSVGASDNAINDKINAGPAGTGALFGGTGKLFMDADLWSTAQATCASLTAADCLAVGTTTGTNSIVVNDINLHVVGAFNPNGIALVTGSTNAGANFRLDPASEFYNAAKFGGVLDKPGLFFYDLAWSAANGGTSLLIGVPDTEAFELNELGNAAQTIWYSSTGTWFDRQADLRQSLAGRSEGWAPSVWLKVVGDWAQRDNITSFSLLNKTYAFDVGFNQDTVGLIGGIDFLNVRENDEAYVFGGQVGYVDSDVRFNSPTRSNLSGMVVGLYGTYMNGGFFLDGIANANFLDLQHFTPTLPGPPAPGSANADVTSFGGQVEAGYQMAIGATGFWEPLASLAYVHTEIDTLSLGTSGSVDFPSTVSFRGSLGARVGMSGDFQYYKVRVALTGRLWDEFDGDNTLLIISPGPSNFSTHDDMGGTFGEVTLGGNLFTTGNNLSAFANIGVKFRSDYQDTNVSVGFRYQW